MPQILHSLKAKGYATPTAIQQKAIPQILEGKDIYGSAQTGTGKTAAFALPILQQLFMNKAQNPKGVKALVLAPTRELAQQISDSFRAYGKDLHLRQAVVYGGVSQRPQADAIRQGADILIATPGRLLDLLDQGLVRLDRVQFFVLDEVDRMLDMGFIHDIKRIIAKVPQKKQTLFFSATLPSEIKKLADGLLQNPVTVQTAPVSSTAVNVRQFVYFIEKENKKNLLKNILSEEQSYHALVFTRTKRGADRLVKNLAAVQLRAEAIHGDKSQGARQRALDQFKKRKVNLLIATDVASRGLDITDITHVINFDMPEEAEVYVHRIGRTGRAGATGNAISFCSPDERPLMKDIYKLAGNKIETIASPAFPKTESPVKHIPEKKTEIMIGHSGHNGHHHSNGNNHQGKSKFRSGKKRWNRRWQGR